MHFGFALDSLNIDLLDLDLLVTDLDFKTNKCLVG